MYSKQTTGSSSETERGGGLTGVHPAAMNRVAMVLRGNVPPAAAAFLHERDADTAKELGPHLMVVSSSFALLMPFSYCTSLSFFIFIFI